MKFFSAALITILCALIAPRAHASIIYPDLMGTTVWFTGIEESSPSNDPLPLYGQPSANGNELLFPTTGSFSAASLDGVASDQTDGKLSLMIVAKEGNAINFFNITENGLTTLNAPFAQLGGDAYTEVNTFAVIKVAAIAGVPVNLPAFNVFLNEVPLGGQYLLSDIGGTSFASGWSGFVHVPLPDNTTKVNITLNNNLFAATLGSGTRAFIDKKAFEIDVDSDGMRIPEPATLVLVVVGLLVCGVLRKPGASTA
jgi:hypothetical protein